MSHPRGIASTVVGALLFASCAEFEVRRFRPPHWQSDSADAWSGTGVLAYEPRPYLVIGTDKEGKPTSTIVMLPDRDRPMEITWKAGLFADVAPKFSLGDGWMLTGSAAEVGSDGGRVLASLGGILAGIGSLTERADAPGIYPLEFRDGAWHLPSIPNE